LDAILARVNGRADDGFAEIRRERIAVVPEDGHLVHGESFGDSRSDVRVVAVDPESGFVIIDTPDPRLTHFRRKLDAYVSDKRTKAGNRQNAPAVEPVAAIRLAEVGDLAGPLFIAGKVGIDEDEERWYELACRGGYRLPVAETAATRAQLESASAVLGFGVAGTFEVPERLLVFAKLSLRQLVQLIERADFVYEFDLVSQSLANWVMLEHHPQLPLAPILPPTEDSPAVALLDTGVATTHPLLQPFIRHAVSSVPGEPSPEDIHGHGTNMAGTALFNGLGIQLLNGAVESGHWLDSARILVAPGTGSAEDDHRRYWPEITSEGVLALERLDGEIPRRRVFAMAVAAEDSRLPEATPWSDAIDILAFNPGGDSGRLICVAVGNADVSDLNLIEGYPQLNLTQTLLDPAQAANCITVGAFTELSQLPPTHLPPWRPVGAVEGLSPHSRCGPVNHGRCVKPDVVFEGGNVAYDGMAIDAQVETLNILTSSRRHQLGQPLGTMFGTSGATAVAARFIAALLRMHPGLSYETVRALVVHSAVWTEAMRAQFPSLQERLAVFGMGVPNWELASSCATERASVIFEDSLPNRTIAEDQRVAKFCELPVPLDAVAATGPVELRVTLSYFAEPNTVRRTSMRGMGLYWDMQGPAETPEQFRARVNAALRDETHYAPANGQGFGWELGIRRRRRGTVQADRWSGDGAMLAGSKLIAVMPVGGWWDQRKDYRHLSTRFSLVATVIVPGVDVYSAIELAVTAPATIEAHVEVTLD